ncbi:MAG: adenylosuccinate lyase [Aminobacterium sp.]|jgi:adenylosuccinate lyase|uniref:adenylosuccinate lyase n=1 Tax=unclassified Aminobacterium TaxID=2685012 RepID=UPI001BCB0AA5|nr:MULTISPECIES: adenylosuccinate lyase [unclassified Aminobacterium]MDD2207674.1 adenylosuccinate lyase [Aminobacterium sp.]MDD3426288.1 adenylosuccinate lyase [Aminobacterium sp.]MDD3708498.1 adenylosuccinate lyase [Aminobacterium sp.]MDD4229700.1 adenylosuccinate lyase [Aminobacterium sp.]MDD4552505.1 adenylosuccinate lyase [Aminobacterium sp.]
MSHIIDSEFYKNGWGTEEARAVFDDRKRYQRWLDIESALAKVQGKLGVIPEEAAEEIQKKAHMELLDIDAIKKGIAETGHSFVPLIKAVQNICEGNAGEYIHYGPTTQDIEDTGMVMEIRDAYHIIFRDLCRMEEILIPLAEKYKDFPMAGRTHNQQGLPITLGLKFAGWIAEVRRDIERMKHMKETLFVGMLHGGTGTMAGLGEKALETIDGVMKELDLGVPATGWGSSRDTFAEYLSVLGMIAGTIGRIANEIFQLSRTEILELQEPLGEHYVGSSTMPHKRNAETSEFVVAMARIVISNANLGLQGMISEHERDTRSWRLDWHSMPESSIMTAKMLEACNAVLAGLDINEKRISQNLDMLHGMLFSEALMFYIGKKVGKQTAHHLIRDAVMQAQNNNMKFRDILMNDPEIKKHVSSAELDAVMDYSKHIGKSVELTEQVIARSKELSASDKEYLA